MKRISVIIVVVSVSMTSCLGPQNVRDSRWMFHDSDRDRIVNTAKRYIGVNYRHGGETPSGFDCSGYVMYVYGKNGITVSRSTDGQYKMGKKIGLQRAKSADLLFFHTGRKRISHVGIYLGDNTFIHAPSTGKQVSYARIDNPYWKRRFIGAVTYFSGRRGTRSSKE